MPRPWLYTGATDDWAELHGYVHRCSVCGSVNDTEGPCSSYCEDALQAAAEGDTNSWND